MTCSAMRPADVRTGSEPAAAPATTLTAPDLSAAVSRLCGGPVGRLELWPGSGNNRLYRAETPVGLLAVKLYGQAGAGQGSRLHREFAALSFLDRWSVEDVPAAVAADPAIGLALYNWVDGLPPARDPAGRPAGDMDAIVPLIRYLEASKNKPGAAEIGPAAESCPHAAELLDQIQARVVALSAVTDSPDLAAFLAERMVPALEVAGQRLRGLYRMGGIAPDAAGPPAVMILSPSDYGFHNMLRRPDGRLLFLDFEYFGWDDPVKLLADTLWHPAYRLSAAEQRAWLDGLVPSFAEADATLPLRLAACLPLYGLRWTAILLNEFLPERWQRRLHAGTTARWDEAKAIQFAKARGWMAEVERLLALPATIPVVDALPLSLPPLTSTV